MLRPGGKVYHEWDAFAFSAMSSHALSQCAIINNYLALPYYAHYTPASASKMKLQKDEVVVVECREQMRHPGKGKAVRDRPDEMGW